MGGKLCIFRHTSSTKSKHGPHVYCPACKVKAQSLCLAACSRATRRQSGATQIRTLVHEFKGCMMPACLSAQALTGSGLQHIGACHQGWGSRGATVAGHFVSCYTRTHAGMPDLYLHFQIKQGFESKRWLSHLLPRPVPPHQQCQQ